MVIVALHVRHGLWSAFQTLGANHPKYMHCLEKLSIVFAVVVAVGFGALPLAVSLLR
jgi:succinate dehydrogenase / fumarate reductase cytochrome b subunit